MPTLDVSRYLADADQLVLQGVCSEKYPDGKAYTIASPSAKIVLQLRRLTELVGDGKELSKDDIDALAVLTTGDDGQPVDIITRLMGPTLAQMLDDGVTSDRMDKITSIVLTHYGRHAMLAQQVVATAAAYAANDAAANGAVPPNQPAAKTKTPPRQAAKRST